MVTEPCTENAFLGTHADLLISSYRRWTGRDLVDPTLPLGEAAAFLYTHAPFALLSHDTAADPLFTYANLAAQRLFAMAWGEIVGMPSRYSAEPVACEARERLLAQVDRDGYIDNYSGVRISRDGRRFLVDQATVWNLVDDAGRPCGQAARLGRWRPL